MQKQKAQKSNLIIVLNGPKTLKITDFWVLSRIHFSDNPVL
jgi:hypothetical protein